MLVLATLPELLSQVVSPGRLHTAVLITPPGELVSVVAQPRRPKSEIRVVVGLAAEVWRETKDQGVGMVDSELGKIMVLPIDDDLDTSDPARYLHRPPLMLLALNSADNTEWDELQTKGTVLAAHLAKSLGRFREYLVLPSSSNPTRVA